MFHNKVKKILLKDLKKKKKNLQFFLSKKPFHLRKHFYRIKIFEEGDIFKKYNC